MIAYQLSSELPSVLSRRVLTRIGDALQGVRGIPKKASISVGLRFVTEREMQRLNRSFRGMDRPTDVLSFSAIEGEAFPSAPTNEVEMGDLVVCVAYATREAKRRSIEPQEELVRLIAHGTLHLAGMDHATQQDEERMFALQESVVEQVLTSTRKKKINRKS